MFPYRSSQGQLRSAFLAGKPGQGSKRWPLESLELFRRPGTALSVGQLVEMSSLVHRGVATGEHWGNIGGTLGEHWGNIGETMFPPKLWACSFIIVTT